MDPRLRPRWRGLPLSNTLSDNEPIVTVSAWFVSTGLRRPMYPHPVNSPWQHRGEHALGTATQYCFRAHVSVAHAWMYNTMSLISSAEDVLAFSASYVDPLFGPVALLRYPHDPNPRFSLDPLEFMDFFVMTAALNVGSPPLAPNGPHPPLLALPCRDHGTAQEQNTITSVLPAQQPFRTFDVAYDGPWDGPAVTVDDSAVEIQTLDACLSPDVHKMINFV